MPKRLKTDDVVSNIAKSDGFTSNAEMSIVVAPSDATSTEVIIKNIDHNDVLLNELKSNVLKEYIASSNSFEQVNNGTLCNVCNLILNTSSRQGKKILVNHEKSQKHVENLKFHTKGISTSSIDVHKKLVECFVSAGLPLNSLDHPKIRNFFKDYFDFTLKTGQTYRSQYLPKIAQNKKLEVIESFRSNPFCLLFDETTDSNGRYILNIFGYTLTNNYQKPKLLDVIELKKTNSENILYEISFLLGSIIVNRGDRNNFRFLVTDGAPYCLKIGKVLKSKYDGLRHIVCICHNLHLLCEDIRKRFFLANDFVVKLKKALIKNKSNQMIYYETTNLPLIRFPVITRWGTFIECCNFLYRNFTLIAVFIKKLDQNYDELKNLLKTDVNEQFKQISSYLFIVSSIKKLEGHGLSLNDQICELDNVLSNIDDLVLKQRLIDIINKNPDLNIIKEYSSNEDVVTTQGIKYLSLTTVSVERGFNFLRNLLADNRSNLKSGNLFDYLSLAINET